MYQSLPVMQWCSKLSSSIKYCIILIGVFIISYIKVTYVKSSNIILGLVTKIIVHFCTDFTSWLLNPYPTAFPYGNGMVLHFYQQQESSTTKTVHKVINKRLKTYV